MIHLYFSKLCRWTFIGMICLPLGCTRLPPVHRPLTAQQEKLQNEYELRRRFDEQVVSRYMPQLAKDKYRMTLIWDRACFSEDRNSFAIHDMCYKYPIAKDEGSYSFLHLEYSISPPDKLVLEHCSRGLGYEVDGQHRVKEEKHLLPPGTIVDLPSVRKNGPERTRPRN